MLPATAAVVLMLHAALTHARAQGKKRSPIYPFDVTIAGETATIEGDLQSAIFAKMKRPVAADAEVVLDAAPEMIIVNVFPTDAAGKLAAGANAKAKVVMVPEGDRFSLDKTMDGKPLEDGTYLMNIVLRSKGTARVLFSIGGGGAKAATPVDNPTEPRAPARPKPPKRPESRGEAPSFLQRAFAPPQSSPEKALETVFLCAKNGRLAYLKKLLPPGDVADGDVRRICSIADAGEGEQKEFVAQFKAGKVSGKAVIDGDKAEIEFLFGPDAKTKEKMELIEIGGRWYLLGF